jgi:hypothetical protein
MDKRRTAREGLRLVESWEASGVCAAAWCRENGISYHSLQYWRRRQKVLSNGSRVAIIPPKASFCEIVSQDGLTAEINGVRLHLERGFDPALFREAITAIRGV